MKRRKFVRSAIFFLLATLLLTFSGCRKDEPDNENPPDDVDPLVIDIAIFPADNPWNTDISGYAVHPNSAILKSSSASSYLPVR